MQEGGIGPGLCGSWELWTVFEQEKDVIDQLRWRVLGLIWSLEERRGHFKKKAMVDIGLL